MGSVKKLEFLINNKYKIAKRIGGGSFGEIFEAYNVHDTNGPDRVVAAKIEKASSRNPQLYQEYIMYKMLNAGGQHKNRSKTSSTHGLPRLIGIPRVYYYGTENNYNILVMEILGPSIEDLFNYCGEKFSVPTVCMLAEQMIERVWFLHEKHWVHRDMKPDNFLMGVENKCDLVYIIDLGLAKKFYREGSHIKFRDGTARYVGCNVHRGYEQSRRDDLEALGYVFLYFLRGRLPWQGLAGRTRKEKYEKIAEKKYSISPETLCVGFPDQFVDYIVYCRALTFEQTPEYIYLLNLFRKLLRAQNPHPRFDWIEQRTTADRAFHDKPDVGTPGAAANATAGAPHHAADVNRIRGAARKKQKHHLSVQDNL